MREAVSNSKTGGPGPDQRSLHSAGRNSVEPCIVASRCCAFAFGPFASFARHPESRLSTRNRHPTLPDFKFQSRAVILSHVGSCPEASSSPVGGPTPCFASFAPFCESNFRGETPSSPANRLAAAVAQSDKTDRPPHFRTRFGPFSPPLMARHHGSRPLAGAFLACPE
jgi:hypothetical protein